MKVEELEKIYQKLLSDGFVEYGKTIPTYLCESIIGKKYVEHISYIGPLLAIRNHIVKNGYYCSRAEGCLVIYDEDHHSYKLNKVLENKMAGIESVHKCAVKAKIGHFDETNFHKHILVSNKILSVLHSMKSALADL